MNAFRALVLAAPLTMLVACTGGGGGSSSASSGPPWEKFRHDVQNTGAGFGSVFPTGTPHVTWRIVIDATPTPGPISSSPAIAGDGTVYIGTEAGTLAAVNSNGTLKWSQVACAACVSATPIPTGTPAPAPLGPLVSSPAIYTLNGVTNLFIGSLNGALLIFQENGDTASCTACFQPNLQEFGAGATAHFVSSPTFTTSSASGNVTGVLIGARIDIPQGSTTRTVGKLYAINSDGSLNWEYPATGAAPIGPITASPVLGLSNTVYFTAADTAADTQATEDSLYAVANGGTLNDGTLLWKTGIGSIIDPSVPTAPFVSSPLTSTQIFVANADGSILSIKPEKGELRWETAPGGVFIASLALGFPAVLTSPTPTPTSAATDTPASSATATPTPTVPLQSIFGVDKAGVFVAIDVATGIQKRRSSLLSAAAAPVISSPALSSDSILVFGDNIGILHAVDTSNGRELWAVPLTAGVPIRSSPAIGSDGTVYVGADDGVLYAVGTQ